MKTYCLLAACIFSGAQSFAQDEIEFYMGGSVKSDSGMSINETALLADKTVQAFYNFNGVKLKDDVKYGRYGIDISKWQGKIDWAQVKADTVPDKIQFVIVKATQGTTIVDKEFANNFANVKANNLLLGCYHFYNQKADPVAQARHFINTVKLGEGDLMPVLDIERNCVGEACSTTPDLVIPKAELIANLKKYIAEVEKHYKTGVIIYTNESFYNDNLIDDFKENFFWIAKYSNTPPKCFQVGAIYDPANVCYKYSKKGCWQYSQWGKVPGIKGDVDLNFLDNFYFLKWQIKKAL